jgi:hypothetical protein
VEAIRYLVFVPLEGYRQLDGHKRVELARLIGRINSALANETFILLGPGRWGSDNPELGIPVTYADIYHARALVEVVADENAPDPSYGTHFFQDLVEAQIYTFALALEDSESTFHKKIFDSARNVLEVLLPKDAAWGTNVKLIDLLATSNGQTMDLVMDGDDGRVMGYLTKVRHKPVRAR